MPMADGSFTVLKKIDDNVYKIDLPGEYGVSCTFNVADLKPYYDDDELQNLRTNSLQQGEDDTPLVDHDDGQPKTKDVQKVLQIMSSQFEAPEISFPILLCASPAFLTLVA